MSEQFRANQGKLYLCRAGVVRFANVYLQGWLALSVGMSMLAQLRAESPMQGTAAVETMLRIPASHFQNRSPEQLSIDLGRGIGPDDAATIALYSNPALRSIRDRRGLASAQLIQAGILPNPVVSYERDYVTGGNTLGTKTCEKRLMRTRKRCSN